MKPEPLVIAQMIESGGAAGAETVLLQLSDELLRRGHTIVPVRYRDGETWLDDQLKDRGLEVSYMPLRWGIDPASARFLSDLFVRKGVDVVHSHEYTMAVYGAAATRKTDVRHVITMHGNQTITDAFRWRMAMRWAFRRSGAVVAVSEATRLDLMDKLGRRAGPIVTVPNGVPRRPGVSEGPVEEFGISEDEVVLLAVGSLVRRKGHEVLLQALARLEEEGLSTPWRLIIAGIGEERENLLRYAEKAGLQERFHLPGRRNDIPDLQAAAHILCMPSLWEGLPLAVLEGMHAGNCIVASRTSGIPEAIEDGANGLLSEPGDVSGLARSLRRVLEDRELREKLGAAALETAHSRFDIGGMTTRYEELYRAR